jgi:hypothetical protein
MLIVFSNKKGTANGEQEIMVQGVKVSSVKWIKFLGLHLKSNLDWEDEINAIVRKCENRWKSWIVWSTLSGKRTP